MPDSLKHLDGFVQRMKVSCNLTVEKTEQPDWKTVGPHFKAIITAIRYYEISTLTVSTNSAVSCVPAILD